MKRPPTHNFVATGVAGVVTIGAALFILWLCIPARPHVLSGSLRAVPAVVRPGAADALAGYLVLAHDAPLGWSYPFACCSGIDCRQVAIADIEEGPEGYVIRGTGEVLPYGDRRLKDSPDGEFHWCSVAGANDGRTIYLFVPPRGF